MEVKERIASKLEAESKLELEPKTKRELELEEIEGKAALEWVEKQNQVIKKTFTTSKEFQEMEKTALSIYEDKRKIPYPGMRDGFLYNFWRDDHYIQGLWRRTTLEEYRKPDPKWEAILNIDELPEDSYWRSLIKPSNHMGAEKENWVYHGFFPSYPDRDLGLVCLSLGGTDASVCREFNIKTKEFVKGGFELREAKLDITWIDQDTLLVGSDFGEGSLTDSGYPRQLKLWKRGEPFENAKLIYECEKSDVEVSSGISHRPESSYSYITKSISFYEHEFYLLNKDLTKKKVPIPLDAMVKDFFNFKIIVQLRKDWSVPNGPKYKSGSVLSIELDSIHDPEHLKTDLIAEPTETCVVESVYSTKNNLIIKLLNNVCGEIHCFQHRDGKWVSHKMPLPELGDVDLVACEDTSDNGFFSFDNFLQPTTLYYFDAEKGSLEPVKSAPGYFNAEGFVVKQLHATSKDKTKIPYFLVHSKHIKLDGETPTLLYGYGGFEIAELPTYLGLKGKLWLEQGGAYVLSNIRGGGEFGPKWHQAALKENRFKAFEDFISVAEDLIHRKVTSPHRLGIMGGSNGGLLVGSCFTMRPDLYQAVVCSVPLLDMMNYHTMLAGASWMAEYGDPADPKLQPIIKSYSPYHNVSKDKHYPEVLFTTSTRDDRVHPGHARKMVDKMQSFGHKVFYYENTEGGHGGASNLKQSAFQAALIYSYLRHKLMKPALVERKPEPQEAESSASRKRKRESLEIA